MNAVHAPWRSIPIPSYLTPLHPDGSTSRAPYQCNEAHAERFGKSGGLPGSSWPVPLSSPHVRLRPCSSSSTHRRNSIGVSSMRVQGSDHADEISMSSRSSRSSSRCHSSRSMKQKNIFSSKSNDGGWFCGSTPRHGQLSWRMRRKSGVLRQAPSGQEVSAGCSTVELERHRAWDAGCRYHGMSPSPWRCGGGGNPVMSGGRLQYQNFADDVYCKTVARDDWDPRHISRSSLKHLGRCY